MKTITTQELKMLKSREDDLLLINTLDPEHFANTQIPGSINIPQSQENFVERVKEVAGEKQRPIVVYCANFDCHSSSEAAKKLEQAGFDVIDYEGGAAAWRDAGEPIAV